MNKFTNWLADNPLMSDALRKAVHVTSGRVSQVKSGLSPIPQHWFPAIARLSKNALQAEELVAINLQRRIRVGIQQHSIRQPKQGGPEKPNPANPAGNMKDDPQEQ